MGLLRHYYAVFQRDSSYHSMENFDPNLTFAYQQVCVSCRLGTGVRFCTSSLLTLDKYGWPSHESATPKRRSLLAHSVNLEQLSALIHSLFSQHTRLNSGSCDFL